MVSIIQVIILAETQKQYIEQCTLDFVITTRLGLGVKMLKESIVKIFNTGSIQSKSKSLIFVQKE